MIYRVFIHAKWWTRQEILLLTTIVNHILRVLKQLESYNVPPLYSLFTSWEDPIKTTFSPLIMVQWKIAIFGDLPLKVIIHFQPQLMDLIFHPWDASLIKRPRKNSSLRTNCLATGVVHQQPLGKLYCFILKIPLYLRISEGSKQFFGHNLSRFTCLENGPNKPTSGRKLPEIHAAPRLPDVLTALRRPFFGNSWRKLQDQPSKSTGFQTPFLGSEKEC